MSPGFPAQLAEAFKQLRMVDNTRELALRLQRRDGTRLNVEFAEIGGTHHFTVIPAAFARALRFAQARRN